MDSELRMRVASLNVGLAREIEWRGQSVCTSIFKTPNDRRLRVTAPNVAECRAAIRLKPDYAEAHVNLGIALKAQGNLKEADAEFRKARDNAPRDSQFAQLIE